MNIQKGKIMFKKFFKLIKKERTELPKEINVPEEKIYTSRDKRGFAEMANREFFTSSDLNNNGMNNCIEFDNAISSVDGEALSRFLEKVVPDMQEELGIAFYGICPKNRNLLLNAISKRRAELILDNMDFFEKGIYRTEGKESINKVCKMMLDILTGNDETVEFKMEEFAFTSGDDPMLQFEHFILDAPECEIRRVTGMVADSDLSVASYYLGEKAKERLFAVVDDETTKLIIEDHSFMDNPAKRDVSEACERIIKEFDVYWSM